MRSYNIAALSLFLALGAIAYADTAAAKAPETPWPIESSITTKAFYDGNLYQTDKGPLASKDTLGLSIAPTIKVTHKIVDGSLSFTYTPTAYFYTRTSNPNYLNQNFGAEQKFKAFDFDWAAKESFVWVAGQNGMPIYATDASGATTYTPGFTAPYEQARTNQFVWGESFNVSKKWDKYLVEFVGAGTYQDYQSRQATTPGYMNCTDRYDVNAGLTVGYKAWENVYLLAGYRLGNQWQGINPTTVIQYTNIYNRFLVGVRGNVLENLTIDFVVGPDFRNYTGKTFTGFDKTQTLWYFAGNATYKPTKVDTLTAGLSRNVVAGSTGASTYEDIIPSVKYARVISSELSADIGLTTDFRNYLKKSSSVTRQYTLYSPCVGVNYTPKGNLSYRAEWLLNKVETGTPRSGTAALVDAQEYSQNVLSVSAKYKF